jgi:predicted nucleic acid-binding protein
MPVKYLLDTNVLIEAHQRYYAFDLAPRFWDALKQQAELGRVRSIDRVKAELEACRDALADWARDIFDEAFASTNDAGVVEKFGKLMTWAQAQAQYTPAARSKFATVADGWLIAYAIEKDFTVVTHEQYSQESKARILIPNACKAFDVPCADTFNMLRDLGVSLG